MKNTIYVNPGKKKRAKDDAKPGDDKTADVENADAGRRFLCFDRNRSDFVSWKCGACLDL